MLLSGESGADLLGFLLTYFIYFMENCFSFLHMVKYKPMWTYGSFFPRFRLDKLKTSVPLNCSHPENDKLKFRYNVKFLDIQKASCLHTRLFVRLY